VKSAPCFKFGKERTGWHRYVHDNGDETARVFLEGAPPGTRIVSSDNLKTLVFELILIGLRPILVIFYKKESGQFMSPSKVVTRCSVALSCLDEFEEAVLVKWMYEESRCPWRGTPMCSY